MIKPILALTVGVLGLIQTAAANLGPIHALAVAVLALIQGLTAVLMHGSIQASVAEAVLGPI